jgi:hypothetical protein
MSQRTGRQERADSTHFFHRETRCLSISLSSMAVEEDERQVFRIYEGLKTLAPGAKWIAADYESPTCPRSMVYPIANAIKNREPPKKQAGRFRKHLCPVSGAPLRLFGEDGGYRNPDLPEDEESTERNDAFFEEAGERNDGNGAFHFEVNNEIGDQNFDRDSKDGIIQQNRRPGTNHTWYRDPPNMLIVSVGLYLYIAYTYVIANDWCNAIWSEFEIERHFESIINKAKQFLS